MDLVTISRNLLDMLEKAAAELDSMEDRQNALVAETANLRKLAEQADNLRRAAQEPRKTIDPSVYTKVARALESENLLQEGLSVDKFAAALAADPHSLADLVVRLVKPSVPSIGQSVKSANNLRSEPGEMVLEGRRVVDHDGWASFLR